jgi:hypothetical protein
MAMARIPGEIMGCRAASGWAASDTAEYYRSGQPLAVPGSLDDLRDPPSSRRHGQSLSTEARQYQFLGIRVLRVTATEAGDTGIDDRTL